MESRCKTTELATRVWIHHVTCFFYTTWPKVCRQTLHPYVIVKYFVPKPWGLLWRNNSLHPSGKARHMIVEPGCRVLLPFSLKSFREVFQFIPKVLRRGSRSGLRAGQPCSSTPNSFFMDLALCSGELCHVDTRKGLPQTAATKLEVQYCLKCSLKRN